MKKGLGKKFLSITMHAVETIVVGAGLFVVINGVIFLTKEVIGK